MTRLLPHGERGWVWAWLSIPVPWRGAGSSGVEHPYSNHIGNVLISAWLDLFSSTAVTWRQQLWRCENSQSLALCSLLRGTSLAQRPQGFYLCQGLSSLSLISPGHICHCCRDHIEDSPACSFATCTRFASCQKPVGEGSSNLMELLSCPRRQDTRVTQVLLTSPQVCFGGPPGSLWCCGSALITAVYCLGCLSISRFISLEIPLASSQ